MMTCEAAEVLLRCLDRPGRTQQQGWWQWGGCAQAQAHSCAVQARIVSHDTLVLWEVVVV